jgi:hypothetical protein
MLTRNLHRRANYPRGCRQCLLPTLDAVHISLPASMVRKFLRLLSQSNSTHPVSADCVPQARIDEDSKRGAPLKNNHRRVSQSESSGAPTPTNGDRAAAHSIQVEQAGRQTRNPRCAPLSANFRRQQRMSELAAHDWMLSVELGTIPFETVEEQTPDLQLADLKTLLSAARNGTLSERRRAITVLAYSRGIRSRWIRLFLKISHKSVFRFLNEFRNGGTLMLLTRKPRSDKKSNSAVWERASFIISAVSEGLRVTTFPPCVIYLFEFKGSVPTERHHASQVTCLKLISLHVLVEILGS